MLTGHVLAGRYRLLELLGEGGMAHVFRAHDELLDRRVAVKVLRSGFAADPEFVSRFRQEARNAASLHHPNIATIYDTGIDGVDFIVMQLVEGEDLEQMLTRMGRLPVHLAARIGVDVARALQAAHDRGIVHRDVKPANILVDRDGDVRVVDFGIARAADAAIGITTAGVILGSAQYVSPEQVAGEDITPASDVFSLGVVLYEAVTGQRPFDGPSPATVALERLHVRPAPPHSVAPGLPEGIDPIVMRALERDPAERYASAGDFGAALESWRIGSLGGVRRRGAGARGLSAVVPALAADAPAGMAGGDGPVADVTFAHGAPVPHQPVGEAVTSLATASPRVRRRAAWITNASPPGDRRAIPSAVLLPLAGAAFVLVAAVVAFRGFGSGGGTAGETSGPVGSAVAVIPVETATPSFQPTPTPAPTPSLSPTPTPEPSPTPAPEPTRESTPDPTPQPTPTPAPTPTPQPAAEPGLPRRDPAETVARFYRLVVDERFEEAAALWTADMRERYPPAGNIDGRFAPTTDIDLVRNEIVAMDADAGTANVAVDLIEYRESGPSPRRFVGDWDLVLVDGRWLMSDPDF